MPRNPPRGSWRISTSTSCSLAPSSASAASRASSTLAPLLSISGIPASRSGGTACLRCLGLLLRGRRRFGRDLGLLRWSRGFTRLRLLPLAPGPLLLRPLEHRGEEAAARRAGGRPPDGSG